MPGMRFIVDRHNASLRLSDKVLVMETPDGDQQRIGLGALRQIIVTGDIALSSALLRACSARGIDVVCLSTRGHQRALFILPQDAHRIDLRLAQFRAYENIDTRLHIARNMVTAKLIQQQAWLQQQAPDFSLQANIETLRHASSTAALMGVEGAAASRYFATYRTLFAQEWQFHKRNRRPPKDPINALLSFGYALTSSDIGRLLTLTGLDPYLGFLHSPQSGRLSLLLDVLESMRPAIDQWVWRLIAEDHVVVDDFTFSALDGCRLNKAGRDKFFSQWHGAESACRTPMRNAVATVLKTVRQQRT